MIVRLVLVALGLALALGAGAQSPSRGADARAMQADDAANPAFLWVKRGAELWAARGGTDAKACADCHGAAETSMTGAAARYPAFDAGLGRPLALDQRIRRCRVERQGLPDLAAESDDLLGLLAFVGLQSRGLPVAARADGPAAPHFEAGRKLYETRLGQFDLSCAQCHDGLAGVRLGGSVIPPARVSGYPIYRLDWQGMGSFQRRLGNCLAGVRAEPIGRDSPERIALELYLMARERGLTVETPAVRP